MTTLDDLALVRTESLPVAAVSGTTPNIADAAGSLAVDMDALGRWDPDAVATVERMITSYREWISDLAQAAATLTGPARKTAEAHVRDCTAFADDVAAGWALAASGPVHECLRWTSAAMAQQRRSYAAATRAVSVTDGVVTVAGVEPGSTGRAQWRPFQLAFLLANLAPVVDLEHRRRGVVDVIWMPTGGGKTEAYLALAAFTMLFRRRTDPTAGGTAVIMRYTLRLLTAQQLQRAASLLCALETLRAANREVLGRERFSIGAWLGRASTPNWRKDALRELRRLAERRRGATRPFLLSRCPACAAALGDVVDGQVLGYGVQSTPGGDRMQASCPNPACAFHLGRTPQGLPVYEVDEDIYAKPPTFLVATVDKFAQLAWNDRARVLFGLDRNGSRERPGTSAGHPRRAAPNLRAAGQPRRAVRVRDRPAVSARRRLPTARCCRNRHHPRVRAAGGRPIRLSRRAGAARATPWPDRQRQLLRAGRHDEPTADLPRRVRQRRRQVRARADARAGEPGARRVRARAAERTG